MSYLTHFAGTVQESARCSEQAYATEIFHTCISGPGSANWHQWTSASCHQPCIWKGENARHRNKWLHWNTNV